MLYKTNLICAYIYLYVLLILFRILLLLSICLFFEQRERRFNSAASSNISERGISVHMSCILLSRSTFSPSLVQIDHHISLALLLGLLKGVCFHLKSSIYIYTGSWACARPESWVSIVCKMPSNGEQVPPHCCVTDEI